MIKETNIDEIFFRSATMATIKFLNDNLIINQVIDNVSTNYNIPVFYNKAQDSQFMRDYFTQYATDCMPVSYVEGDFDMEPFAVLNMSGITVKTAEMTNKFVRGNYIIQENDSNGFPINKPYSALLYAIPLDVKYAVEIRTDDSSQTFKIIQSFLEGIFKNFVVNFSYKGQKIRCNVSLDNDYSPDKKMEFTYTDEQKERLKFNLVMECYMPVFDKTTSLFKGNVIRNFRAYIEDKVTITTINVNPIT